MSDLRVVGFAVFFVVVVIVCGDLPCFMLSLLIRLPAYRNVDRYMRVCLGDLVAWYNARLRTVHRQLAADRFPPGYGAAIVTW